IRHPGRSLYLQHRLQRQDVDNAQQVLVYGPDMLDGFIERREYGFAMDEARHFASAALQQRLHGNDAQAAGQYPVHARGATATLDMPEDRNTHVVMWESFLYSLGH